MIRTILARAAFLQAALIVVPIVMMRSSFAIRPSLVKVNSQGEYLAFPGITIIAPIEESHQEMWHEIRNALLRNPLISNYYTFTPVSSYHMTTTDLFIQYQFEEGYWNTFLSKNLSFFNGIYQALQSSRVRPEVTLSKAEVGRTIRILVQIDSELAQQLIAPAKRFSLERHVPQEFHITLGHLYKEISDDQLVRLRQEVRLILSRVLSAFGSRVTLQEPRLCHFQDMTAFLPWDGATLPF